jgi:hypothetical protein
VSEREARIERRTSPDRRMSGSALDVSRVEHENLFRQVDEALRRIARIELELHRQDARIETLEHASGGASPGAKRTK